jgi:hypothetical protein
MSIFVRLQCRFLRTRRDKETLVLPKKFGSSSRRLDMDHNPSHPPSRPGCSSRRRVSRLAGLVSASYEDTHPSDYDALCNGILNRRSRFANAASNSPSDSPLNSKSWCSRITVGYLAPVRCDPPVPPTRAASLTGPASEAEDSAH